MVNARRLALIFACLGLYGLAMIHLFGGKVPKIGFYGFLFSWFCLALAVVCLAFSLRKTK